MDEIRRTTPLKGRGAVSNDAGRFEPQTTVAIDDGWGSGWTGEGGDGEAAPLETRLTEDATRTIIARNASPDIPFDRSINPYRGCEHGCIYCFARPSHAYLGLSPGLDFESWLFYKPRAAELLAAELRSPRYKCAPMGLGTNTDPYQPVERRLGLTRAVLEVLRDFRHPVTIVTKGALIRRDIDILAPMAGARLAVAAISVTTLDPRLARSMEPRAASPARRLETIRALASAGIPVAVLAAPMIPGLNDHELEAILEAAAEAGAEAAGYVPLRLPHEIKTLFTEWLEAHVPMRASHVLNLIREIRGGALNDSRFGERMRGQGPYADLLSRRFHLARRRLGLDRREIWDLDTTRFRPPPEPGAQMSLF